MKKRHTTRQGGMNRKSFLKNLTHFIKANNDNVDLTLEKAAEILLDEIERLGMLPVSRYSGFMSSCTINDWEENITDDDISGEMDRQRSED